MTSKPDILWVWDIDSTCIDNNHREHLVEAGDWDRFHAYENIIKDVPTGWVQDMDLWRRGRFRYGNFMYLTARNEDARLGTYDNLNRWDMITPSTELIMKDTPREGSAHEKSCHFKPRVLLMMAHQDPNTVFLFLDDDEDILRVMYEIDHPRIHVIDSLDSPEDEIRKYVSRYGIKGAW